MTLTRPRVLLIGYGNPGRLDDGLGPALAARMARLDIPGLDVESDYQLTVEDASDVAAYDVVIFADASVSATEPFSFEQLTETSEPSFTSHGVEPPEVLGLAQRLFSAATRAYVLGIRGYEFNEFGERLSPAAQQNLDAAAAFLEERIRSGNLD